MSGERDMQAFALQRHAIGDGLSLVPMSSEDAAVIGAMCAALEPWLSYPFSAAELIRFFSMQEPHAPRFSVLHGGVLAGALVVRRDWFRGPYVHMLAVAPSLHGRGIGSTLIGFVEAEARRGRERNLWIAATATNTGARRLYARCGFSEVAHLDGLVRDGVTEVLMRKRLVSANSQ
jgi:ribosomal protein S18 acetylase RimI-like enzyme